MSPAGCAAVVNAAPVLFVQETGEPDWWPGSQPLPEGVGYATALEGVDPRQLRNPADRQRPAHGAHASRSISPRRSCIGPRAWCWGWAATRARPPKLVERGVKSLLESARAGAGERQGNCHHRLETRRAGLDGTEPQVRLADAHLYGRRTGRGAGHRESFGMVKQHVGTRAVAEPAALLAAGATRLLVRKAVVHGRRGRPIDDPGRGPSAV